MPIRKHSWPRSYTAVHFLPGDFSGALLANLEPAAFADGAFRAARPGRPARLTSAELPAPFAFDQLLFSVNAVFPSGGSLEAEVRVKTAAGWSPWFSYGTFTAGLGGESAKPRENAFGVMDVDLLRLKTKAVACRYRVTLLPRAGCRPVLRLASVVFTDSTAPYRPEALELPPDQKLYKLPVPAYSQMAQKVPYRRDICSPVSLAMVFSALGRRTAALGNTAAVLDANGGIYGNWFFNTAHAGASGFYSFLSRLNSLEEARAYIRAGVPVIASVTFGPGELRNAPLEKTKGHLLVIKGFTKQGDVIVNDPAAPSAATVERVYRRAEFGAAWLKNKHGLCYIVAKDLGKFTAVKAPVTDFFSEPLLRAGDKDRLIESQLVENERAELLRIEGDWAQVRALEQHSLKHGGRDLQPYTGWLPAGSLAFSLPLAPGAIVRAKTAAGSSVGVKLRPLAAPAGHTAAMNSAPVKFKDKALNPLPLKISEAALRRNILAAARLFLGDPYYWGGRSAWGVDCSGLANIAYRAWGVDLPRNAHDQLAASRRLHSRELKPADLIFSAEASAPSKITHVMLYSGGGRLIEATRESGDVREITFAKKFGAPLAGLASGAGAGARLVYFGRLLGAK